MSKPLNHHIFGMTTRQVLSIPPHVSLLKRIDRRVTSRDGLPIETWRIDVEEQSSCMAEWAAHFRRHYCADEMIDHYRSGTGLSRREYLKQLVFPDQRIAPGPSIRAGDFAEILVCDFVEFILGYEVPRGRFSVKAVRNESLKGVDIIGMQIGDVSSPSREDILIAFEVKAKLTGQYEDRLQVAVRDSSKDALRMAETLNATKRRLLDSQDRAAADRVERFQNPIDLPYVFRSGAAAVLSEAVMDDGAVCTTDCSDHKNRGALSLLVVLGDDLMSLVTALYDTAADEA